MGIVRRFVKGVKKAGRLTILFDTGAARSLVKSEFAEEFTTPRDLPTTVEVTVAEDHRVSCTCCCNFG